jgi:hypothetical protein
VLFTCCAILPSRCFSCTCTAHSLPAPVCIVSAVCAAADARSRSPTLISNSTDSKNTCSDFIRETAVVIGNSDVWCYGVSYKPYSATNSVTCTAPAAANCISMSSVHTMLEQKLFKSLQCKLTLVALTFHSPLADALAIVSKCLAASMWPVNSSRREHSNHT